MSVDFILGSFVSCLMFSVVCLCLRFKTGIMLGGIVLCHVGFDVFPLDFTINLVPNLDCMGLVEERI